MASLSLALDEIISSQREKIKGGGRRRVGVGRLSGGRGPRLVGRRGGGIGGGQFAFSDVSVSI